MEIYHERDMIYFYDKSIDKLGYTNFNEELWNIIKDRKFSVKYKTLKDNTREAKYIMCNSLKKLLHQIVIDFYYGEDIRKEMYNKEFIIEHHDNDGFNCTIENLSFLSKKRNTSKGFGYDVERVDFLDNVAINIFRDFETQNYQITLAFNTPCNLVTDDGKTISLATMYLVYDNNFKIVINDATNILDLLKSYGKLDINKLNFNNWLYEPCTHLYLSKEERYSPIINRNGKLYFNMDSPHGIIKKISPKDELYK